MVNNQSMPRKKDSKGKLVAKCLQNKLNKLNEQLCGIISFNTSPIIARVFNDLFLLYDVWMVIYLQDSLHLGNFLEFS